jgi:hypothetical protein
VASRTLGGRLAVATGCPATGNIGNRQARQSGTPGYRRVLCLPLCGPVPFEIPECDTLAVPVAGLPEDGAASWCAVIASSNRRTAEPDEDQIEQAEGHG